MADRLEPVFQFIELVVPGQAGILGAEAFGIAERIVVDEADKAVKLHERILQRRRREQHLRRVGKRALEGLADAVVRPVDVAQPMRFVDDDQIPGNDHQLVGIAARQTGRSK